MIKSIVIAAVALLAVTVLAIVSPGNAQKITVVRDARQQLQFMVDDGKNFVDVDKCAKHCYQRSQWVNEESEWANLVNIHVAIPMAAEDRQYIGDRFVENKVYPQNITWIEDGVTNRVVYKPDDESPRKARELK
jgi:hypothetical protein